MSSMVSVCDYIFFFTRKTLHETVTCCTTMVCCWYVENYNMSLVVGFVQALFMNFTENNSLSLRSKNTFNKQNMTIYDLSCTWMLLGRPGATLTEQVNGFVPFATSRHGATNYENTTSWCIMELIQRKGIFYSYTGDHSFDCTQAHWVQEPFTLTYPWCYPLKATVLLRITTICIAFSQHGV